MWPPVHKQRYFCRTAKISTKWGEAKKWKEWLTDISWCFLFSFDYVHRLFEMHTHMEKRRRKEWLTNVCGCFLFSFYAVHRLSQMHAYNKDTVNSFCCEERFWARRRWVETHCFGELAARLHDPEAQRDYLRVQQKVDDLLLISLTREGKKEWKATSICLGYTLKQNATKQSPDVCFHRTQFQLHVSKYTHWQSKKHTASVILKVKQMH